MEQVELERPDGPVLLEDICTSMACSTLTSGMNEPNTPSSMTGMSGISFTSGNNSSVLKTSLRSLINIDERQQLDGESQLSFFPILTRTSRMETGLEPIAW